MKFCSLWPNDCFIDKVEQLLQGQGDKKLSELQGRLARKAQPGRSASGKKFIVFGNTD